MRSPSMPHASTGKRTPLNEETASTSTSVSGLMRRTVAAISATGLMTPVLVSLWTTVMASTGPSASAACSASATCSGLTAVFHGTSTRIAALSHPLATLYQRWLNAPLTKEMTRPLTRLRIAASCKPVPEAATM